MSCSSSHSKCKAEMRFLWLLIAMMLVPLVSSSSCGHQRCHRSKRSSLWIEIMKAEPVTSAFYRVGNLTCIMCGPGYFVQSHCQVNHTQSQCTPCRPNTYNPDHTRALRCKRCTDCNQGNSETLSRCTATSDAECICQEDYGHVSYDDTGHGHDCILCGPRGKISVLNKENDERICVSPCPQKSFYSEVDGMCKGCTDCEVSGNVTTQACTATANAVCVQPPPATTPEGDAKPDETTGGLGGGPIAGIVVVVAAILVVLAAVIYCYCQRNSGNEEGNKKSIQLNPEWKLGPPEGEKMLADGTGPVADD